MYPVPEPMEHQQRMDLAQMIADRLIARLGKLVKAIGLYGSLARNEDGPYSDIEMFCVVRATGETYNYEWCAGPWKAEVNVRDEASLRDEALVVLAVELAQRTASALGLEHRHLYGSSSSVLEEAVKLPDPPDGFYALAQMVMAGNLHHAPMIVSVCDTLWLGLVRWAEERRYTLVASQEIPF